MAIRWRNYLAIVGLVFALVLAACGEDPVDAGNDSENQNQTNQTNNETNQNQNNQNNVEPAGCQDNDDCLGDTYCHEESCVSRQFICSLQGCAGTRGVCNPDDGIDGECVNAESCSAETDCLDDFLCIEGTCLAEEEACAECTDAGDECVFDHNSLSVECEDPFAVCEPGVRECDGDVLTVCNSLGTSQQSYECNRGCDPETLTCEQPAGASCSNPYVAEHDDIYEFTWSEFSNDYDPGPSTGCVDESQDLRTRGGDVTFELEVDPGQTGVVELFTSVDYASLYVLEDCSEGATSCIEPNGSRAESVHNEFVRAVSFFNDSDEPQIYHVVADSGIGAANQTASVQIGITDQVCEPGEPVCADSELGVCNPYGTGYETDPNLSCALGCASSSDATIAECRPQEHSSCQNAVLHEGNAMESYTYDIIDFAGADELSTSDCDERDVSGGQATTFEGPTAYFEVDLEDRQRLNANLASEFDAGVWVSSGCDDGTCLWAQNTNDSTEMTEYIADGNETVYVVVQAVDADVEIGEFTLDLSIDDPECNGFAAGDVLGCQDSSVISYCTGGDYPSTYSCDGGCENDQCINRSGDFCLEAIPLDNEDSFSGSFASHTNYLAPTSCTDGDSFSTPTGPEYIFEIETEDNQLVQVDLQSNSTSVGFYLLDSCDGASSAPNDSCVYGNLPSTKTDFFLDEGGTYYLVVDSTNANNNSSFTLDLDISDGVCLPEASRCTGDVVERCGDAGNGYDQIANCLEGCDDEDEPICTPPADAKTRCVDPYVITESGQLVDNFERYDQDQNLRSGDCFDDGTVGPDAFYEVTLEELEGFKVTATADAGAGHEAGIYLADEGNCPSNQLDPNDACLDTISFAADGSEEGVLEYYSAEGGTFLIGLAALTDFDAGDFSLDVEFFGGECNPDGDDICVSPELAERCTSSGEIQQFECDYGCEDGYCLPLEGNTCDRPLDVDAEGDVDGNGVITYSHSNSLTGTEYSNDFDPYVDGESCTGYYGDGADVVYAFEGWKDDQVTVELSSDYDGALWITNNCSSSAGNSCFEGTDTVFGPGTEMLEFTVPQRNTYFIVADAVQSGATGDFDTTISVEPGPRVDDPELVVSDEDTLQWEMEYYQSDTGQFFIENAGEFPLDFDITTTVDWIEFTPASDSVDGGDTLPIDVDVTCPDNRGTNLLTEIVITTNDLDNESYAFNVQMTCNAPPPGALSVTVDGLPEGTDHDIDIVDDEGDVVDALPQDGEVPELAVGSYQLVAQSVYDGSDEYAADPVSFEIQSEANTEATVTYEQFITGDLDVTVEGLPPGAEPTIEILDDQGTVVDTVPASGAVTDLEVGDYDLDPQLYTDGSDEYDAPPVSVTITDGGTETATVEYELVP